MQPRISVLFHGMAHSAAVELAIAQRELQLVLRDRAR
jgi:hypothetical protein